MDATSISAQTLATPAPRRGVPEATVARLPVYLRALHALSETAGPPSAPRPSPRPPGSTAPSCARTCRTWAPTAPAASATTSTTSSTRSPASSGCPSAARSSSSASATSATRSPATAASPPAGSRSTPCSTPTRPASASRSPASRCGTSTTCRRVVTGVSIGVIATPADAAQEVCDRLVAAGVTSILNFAPTVLSVPDGVDLRKVDLSIELQILSFHEHRKAARPEAPGRERPRRRHLAPQRTGLAARRGHRRDRRHHRRARRAEGRSRSARPSCWRPATGSRSTPTPTASTPASTPSRTCCRAAPGCRSRSCRSTSTCTGRPRRSCTCSRSPAGSTRWSSASRRSSASCGAPTRARRRHRRPGAARAVPDAPCGSASGPTPRPASTRPAGRWSASGSSTPSAPSASSTAAACWSSGPARWAPWPAPRCAAPGVGEVVVANRTPENAARLATSLDGRGVGLEALEQELVAADVVVTSTGATGSGRHRGPGREAVAQRDGRPLGAARPGAAARHRPGGPRAARRHARRPGDAADLAGRHRGRSRRRGRPRDRHRGGRRVPRLAARQPGRADRRRPAQPGRRGRRGRAGRLSSRLPDLDERERAEVEQAVRRVVQSCSTPRPSG